MPRSPVVVKKAVPFQNLYRLIWSFKAAASFHGLMSLPILVGRISFRTGDIAKPLLVLASVVSKGSFGRKLGPPNAGRFPFCAFCIWWPTRFSWWRAIGSPRNSGASVPHGFDHGVQRGLVCLRYRTHLYPWCCWLAR